MGNARMIHDGRWKLIQYYSRDPKEPPSEVWYDLALFENENIHNRHRLHSKHICETD